MIHRLACHIAEIHLSGFQSGNEFLWREVDEPDVVCEIEKSVWDRLPDLYTSDLRDGIIQALYMLDIDCGVDRDPCPEDLFNVLVPFQVPGVRGIGMGQFIDKDDRWFPGDDGIEIHLTDIKSLVPDMGNRNSLESGSKSIGLYSFMRLDIPDHDIGPFCLVLEGIPEHRVGLSHPRSVAEVDDQFPMVTCLFLSVRDAKEILGNRSLSLRVTHSFHGVSTSSSALLRDKTLT
jgi:hypothetical protein